MSVESPMSAIVNQLLVWRSGRRMWLVAHPEIDIIAQGRTRKEAINAYLETLGIHVLLRFRRSVCSDKVCSVELRRPPPEVRERWLAKHKATQAKNVEEDHG